MKSFMEISLNLKLGLIGNAIAKSRAPSLHLFLGNLHGFKLTYDLFDPMSNQKIVVSQHSAIKSGNETENQGY